MTYLRFESCTSKEIIQTQEMFHLRRWDGLGDLLSDVDITRMLEDPSYSQTVRWGDDNDSFVVLEVKLKASAGCGIRDRGNDHIND